MILGNIISAIEGHCIVSLSGLNIKPSIVCNNIISVFKGTGPGRGYFLIHAKRQLYHLRHVSTGMSEKPLQIELTDEIRS